MTRRLITLLQGQKVRLRGLELEDADVIMQHWNNWELKRYLMIIVPNSRQEEEEFIRGTWRSRHDGTAFLFGIELLDTDHLIGTVGIHGVDWINRTADYGTAIWSSQHWNKGFGAEATQLLLKYAFEQLNLNRIELRVFAFNKRAKTMYEKAGFQQMGVRRQSVFRDGAYHDEYTMDILREEWEQTEQGD